MELVPQQSWIFFFFYLHWYIKFGPYQSYRLETRKLIEPFCCFLYLHVGRWYNQSATLFHEPYVNT